jgi:hypothetical protein
MGQRAGEKEKGRGTATVARASSPVSVAIDAALLVTWTFSPCLTPFGPSNHLIQRLVIVALFRAISWVCGTG